MAVKREPKTFYFDLNLPKDFDKNLKHEIEFIIKQNESLAEPTLRNEIKQLLSKYKQGSEIPEHGKQKNE